MQKLLRISCKRVIMTLLDSMLNPNLVMHKQKPNRQISWMNKVNKLIIEVTKIQRRSQNSSSSYISMRSIKERLTHKKLKSKCLIRLWIL